MRRLIVLVLALGFLALLPTAAADGLTDECETFRASSIPLLHPELSVGEVQLCDEDRDGAYDTVAFETRYVQNEGFLSVTDEEKDRRSHEDRDTNAQFRLEPGTPGKVIVYQDAHVSDDGNDAQVDDAESEGGVYTHLGQPGYVLTASDDNGNGVPQSYGVLACSVTTCLGPRDIPQIPDRIELPDTVIPAPIVGYVP